VDSEADVLDVGPGDHLVFFYLNDAELTGQVSEYLLQAIRSGGAAIAIASPVHRASFGGWLTDAGVDVTAARASGSYLDVDAAETMRGFMVADWPDPALFWQAISPLVRQAAKSGQPVHIFGEMVSLLWDAGLVNAAIEVEAMWNELGSQYLFTLCCSYPAQSVNDSRHHDALTEVCRLHAVAVGLPAEPDPTQR
jgi:hypothetical protein